MVPPFSEPRKKRFLTERLGSEAETEFGRINGMKSQSRNHEFGFLARNLRLGKFTGVRVHRRQTVTSGFAGVANVESIVDDNGVIPGFTFQRR